jgi:2-(3-amino-3-carboxypropyl)histidine synthase
MNYRKLEELQERYDFNLDKIVKEIQKQKVKKVLLQFPDGLKPYATLVCEAIEERINSSIKPAVKDRIEGIECAIFLGSCFGACDVPNTDAQLLVQFGHAPWGEDKSF